MELHGLGVNWSSSGVTTPYYLRAYAPHIPVDISAGIFYVSTPSSPTQVTQHTPTMLPRSFYPLLTAVLGATAVPTRTGGGDTVARSSADQSDVKKVLIGGGPSGTIAVANYDGSSFDILSNNTISGTDASWLLLKEPNLLYAVDENSNNTRLFNVSEH